MARITVEDCLTKENNRFALVQLASKRTKQLLQGSKPLIDENKNNKAVVLALREIAGGKVRFMTEEEARLAREQAELEANRALETQATAPVLEPHNGSNTPPEMPTFAPPVEEALPGDDDGSEAAEGDSDADDVDDVDDEEEDGEDSGETPEKGGGNEEPSA